MMRKLALLFTSALASVASPSLAQQATDNDQISQAEIIVSARKRNEALQDVPAAITAFSSAALERQQISSARDLNLAAPGLAIAELPGGGGIAQIYLRGAGQDDSGAPVEPPITVYLDGVPYTKAPGALFDIIEFERIEVLRGPQGTLYGRNSTGGAIKYITRKPSLTDTTFLGDVTVGSFSRIDVRAAVSTPLSPRVGIKLDVISRNDDGFVTDALATPANGRVAKLNRTARNAVRAALLAEADDRLSFYVTADYTRDRSGPQSGIPFISSALAANLNAAGQISRSAPLYGVRRAAPEIGSPQEFDGYGGQITTTYSGDVATLTSIMGYRGFKLNQAFDTDGGPAVNGLVSQTGAIINRPNTGNYVRDWKNDTLTWELQLASSGKGPLTWVVGGFLMQEKNRSNDLFGTFSTTAAAPAASLFQFRQTTKSAALFGELTYTLFDKLELTAGGRYTRDTKDMTRTHSAALGLPIFSGVAYSGGTGVTWSQFTPRFIAKYEVASDLSIYASYSTGFQAGAFQSLPFASAASSNTPFNPTKVKTIETGLRSQFFDRKLTLNLTGFQSKYTDLPSTIIAANGGFTVFTNDVEVKGIELDLSVRPIPGLSLYATGGLYDDKYNRSVVANSLVPGANGINRLKYTPHETFKIGGEYAFDLGGGRIAIGGNVAHSGDMFAATVNTPFTYQPAYEVIDAFVSYETTDQRFKMTLAGKNLADTLYALRSSGGGGGVYFFAPPRSWSLTLRTKL